MKSKIIIAVVLIILIFAALFFAQIFIFKCQVSILNSLFGCQNNNGQPSSGTAGPNQQPPEITPKKAVLPKVLYNLAGSVKNLEKNAVIVDAFIPFLDEKGELANKTETRKALVTPLTKFSRLIFVPLPNSDRRTPQESSIKFNEIKVGDPVEVVSNQDISNKQEFEATLIRILQKSL